MSTILSGVTESVKSFITGNLPEKIDKTLDFAEMYKELGELIKDAEKEKENQGVILENAQKVNILYHQLIADSKSLEGGAPYLQNLLADKSTAFQEQLAKLDADGVKDLGQALIDCTRDAGTLSKSFSDITEILNSLSGDLKKGEKGDYAYEQLYKELEALDKKKEEEAKDKPLEEEKKWVYQLENFKPEPTINKLGEVKDSFETLYGKLVNISLEYQLVVPYFAKLTKHQEDLVATMATIEENLKTNTETAKKAASEELALSRTKGEALTQLELLQNDMKTVSTLFPGEVAEKEDPEPKDGESSVADAKEDSQLEDKEDKVVDKKKSKAKKVVDPPTIVTDPVEPIAAIKKRIITASEHVTKMGTDKKELVELMADLKVVLAARDAFDDKIAVQVKQLNGTKEAVQTLIELVDTIGTSTSDLKKELDKQPNLEQDQVMADFLAQLKTLDEIQVGIAALNEGIDQVKSQGDVKVYFAEINDKLAAFPETGKKVINNSLKIEHTLTDLKQWAGQLDREIGKALNSALGASAFSSTATIADLETELNGKKKAEADLKFSNEELVVETLLAKYPEQPAETTLADWQGFLKTELDRVTKAGEDSKKTVAFLKKMLP